MERRRRSSSSADRASAATPPKPPFSPTGLIATGSTAAVKATAGAVSPSSLSSTTNPSKQSALPDIIDHNVDIYRTIALAVTRTVTTASGKDQQEDESLSTSNNWGHSDRSHRENSNSFSRSQNGHDNSNNYSSSKESISQLLRHINGGSDSQNLPSLPVSRSYSSKSASQQQQQQQQQQSSSTLDAPPPSSYFADSYVELLRRRKRDLERQIYQQWLLAPHSLPSASKRGTTPTKPSTNAQFKSSFSTTPAVSNSSTLTVAQVVAAAAADEQKQKLQQLALKEQQQHQVDKDHPANDDASSPPSASSSVSELAPPSASKVAMPVAAGQSEQQAFGDGDAAATPADSATVTKTATQRTAKYREIDNDGGDKEDFYSSGGVEEDLHTACAVASRQTTIGDTDFEGDTDDDEGDDEEDEASGSDVFSDERHFQNPTIDSMITDEDDGDDEDNDEEDDENVDDYDPTTSSHSRSSNQSQEHQVQIQQDVSSVSCSEMDRDDSSVLDVGNQNPVLPLTNGDKDDEDEEDVLKATMTTSKEDMDKQDAMLMIRHLQHIYPSLRDLEGLQRLQAQAKLNNSDSFTISDLQNNSTANKSKTIKNAGEEDNGNKNIQHENNNNNSSMALEHLWSPGSDGTTIPTHASGSVVTKKTTSSSSRLLRHKLKQLLLNNGDSFTMADLKAMGYSYDDDDDKSNSSSSCSSSPVRRKLKQLLHNSDSFTMADLNDLVAHRSNIRKSRRENSSRPAAYQQPWSPGSDAGTSLPTLESSAFLTTHSVESEPTQQQQQPVSTLDSTTPPMIRRTRSSAPFTVQTPTSTITNSPMLWDTGNSPSTHKNRSKIRYQRGDRHLSPHHHDVQLPPHRHHHHRNLQHANLDDKHHPSNLRRSFDSQQFRNGRNRLEASSGQIPIVLPTLTTAASNGNQSFMNENVQKEPQHHCTENNQEESTMMIQIPPDSGHSSGEGMPIQDRHNGRPNGKKITSIMILPTDNTTLTGDAPGGGEAGREGRWWTKWYIVLGVVVALIVIIVVLVVTLVVVSTVALRSSSKISAVGTTAPSSSPYLRIPTSPPTIQPHSSTITYPTTFAPSQSLRAFNGTVNATET